MRRRKRLSNRQNKRNFRRGNRPHTKNVTRVRPMRGGYRL